jgi:hypothetical protein
MHLIESLSTVTKTSRENWKRTWERAAASFAAEQHEKATNELIRESSIRPKNHLAASNMEPGLDESWRARFDDSQVTLPGELPVALEPFAKRRLNRRSLSR